MSASAGDSRVVNLSNSEESESKMVSDVYFSRPAESTMRHNGAETSKAEASRSINLPFGFCMENDSIKMTHLIAPSSSSSLNSKLTEMVFSSYRTLLASLLISRHVCKMAG